MRIVLTAALVLGAALAVAGSATAARDAGDDGLAAAMAATAQFGDVNVATAAGYGEFRDAQNIACIDKRGEGGMGIHYVSGAFVGDAVLDPTTPEALVYEPRPDGLHLVALEYIVFQAPWDAVHSEPPSLFGEEFELVGAGNRYGIPTFYELHAWVWKFNPHGLFNDWNPRVSCAHA
jgi:hypothetical protein